MHRRAFGRWFRYQNLIEIEKQRDLEKGGEREREFDSSIRLWEGRFVCLMCPRTHGHTRRHKHTKTHRHAVAQSLSDTCGRLTTD